jgi:hypothetical protein
MHAIRPLLQAREAWIAGLFGLVHGLAFATALGQLGLDGWTRVTSLLGFNLGIEAMQLLVVVAALPCLLLLSRTRGYSWLRMGGALCAAAMSVYWIGERLLQMQLSFAQPIVWMAGGAFVIGLGWWLRPTAAAHQSAGGGARRA